MSISSALKVLITKAGGEPPETDNLAQLVEAFAASYTGGAESLSIGTVTTGTAGSSAAASITDGKLNLTIPRGDTGSAGANGTKGDTGPAGKGVKSLALTKGADGTITGGTITYTDDSTGSVTVTGA